MKTKKIRVGSFADGQRQTSLTVACSGRVGTFAS